MEDSAGTSALKGLERVIGRGCTQLIQPASLGVAAWTHVAREGIELGHVERLGGGCRGCSCRGSAHDFAVILAARAIAVRTSSVTPPVGRATGVCGVGVADSVGSFWILLSVPALVVRPPQDPFRGWSSCCRGSGGT